MEKIYHCQICARDIKVVPTSRTLSTVFAKPVIAHHGYQRPWGEGWQSSSCDGAREKPYEVSCDAIQPAIDRIKAYKKNVAATLKEFLANPPVELKEIAHWRGHQPEKVFKRPRDFDPEKSKERSYGYSYENEYNHIRGVREREIKNAMREVERLGKRLADWKPSKV